MTAAEQQMQLREKIDNFLNDIQCQCLSCSKETISDQVCELCRELDTSKLLSLLHDNNVVIKASEQKPSFLMPSKHRYPISYEIKNRMIEDGFVKVIPVKEE